MAELEYGRMDALLGRALAAWRALVVQSQRYQQAISGTLRLIVGRSARETLAA
jgi:hypothetical protein